MNEKISEFFLYFLYVTLVSFVQAAGGRGGSRGVGGATGVRYRHKEGDETGTLNVILVVILPVLQMILVLIIIAGFRILYCKCCKKPEPKLLQVVTSAQLHRQRLLMSEYELQQQMNDYNLPPPSIRDVLMTKPTSSLTKQQLKQQEMLLNCHLKPSLEQIKQKKLPELEPNHVLVHKY